MKERKALKLSRRKREENDRPGCSSKWVDHSLMPETTSIHESSEKEMERRAHTVLYASGDKLLDQLFHEILVNNLSSSIQIIPITLLKEKEILNEIGEPGFWMAFMVLNNLYAMNGHSRERLFSLITKIHEKGTAIFAFSSHPMDMDPTELRERLISCRVLSLMPLPFPIGNLEKVLKDFLSGNPQ